MRTTDLTTVALTLIAGLALLVAPACTESQEPDESPREQSAAMQTVVLDVTLPEDTEPSQVEAIAMSAEKLAGSEVVGAKVKARQQKDGPMILTIEVWGPNLESPDTMIEGLRAQHPVLVDTPIAVVEKETDEQPEAEVFARKVEGETPEETKARIIQELRDQGVEGEIHVDVTEGADGHRKVEVRVEDDKAVEAIDPEAEE